MRYSALKATTLFAYCLLSSTQALYAQVSFESNKDDFTGEDRSYVLMMPSSGDDFGVAWKCEFDGLNIVIVHTYLAGDSDDDIIVLYKFDDEPASQRNWYGLHSNNKVTYFDMSDVPVFTEKSLNANSIMVRIIDPSDQETFTATFNPSGLSEYLSKLSCK